MRKVFYWATAIFQALLLIAAFGIQHFSMKKMGMMRYVVYINYQWEAQYPIAALRNTAIVFLVVLFTAIVLRTLMGNYIINKKVLIMLIVGGIVTSAFVYFTLSYSTESYRSYYFTGLILAIIALIQDIKTIVYLKSMSAVADSTFKFL